MAQRETPGFPDSHDPPAAHPTLRIFNTMQHAVVPFVPLEPGRVRMYSCGPTVYRYVHIGNLRTFLMADWLRRALGFFGHDVTHVKNLTDVGHMRVELLDRGEDKLVAQARQEGKSSAEIAAFYSAAFFADEQQLNILPAHVFPRATEHVAEMITIIADLEARGYAYRGGDNVYFDVARFPDYGKLSGNRIAGLLAGVRDGADPHKRNPEDFALWKGAEPGRELSWPSPWGPGFPGWHIECSAMAIKYLGRQFDIHTGGVDNIFPHHEGEIAQSEAHTGEAFANYWIHGQHLLVDGLKMAKSTGNAYTLSDIVARGFEPMALRLLFAMVHYRRRSNFTFGALAAAQRALQRLRGRVAALRARAGEPGTPQPAVLQHFARALADDLNLPRALPVLWRVLRADAPGSPADRLATVLACDAVLGIRLDAPPAAAALVPPPVASLVARRDLARRQRDYAEADALRASIAGQGYRVHDMPAGSVVVPRAADDEFDMISRSPDVPRAAGQPDRACSVLLVAHDNRDDLERCLRGLWRTCAGVDLEIVIIDNGSTDDTIGYLQQLVRTPRPAAPPLRVYFADHHLGFAAARNAGIRAARGALVVLLDTSIEPQGDWYAPLARALADPAVGVVGPYGLVSDDLKEYREDAGPRVDAIEGYLMAFRRAVLHEIGAFDERYRFYRLLDIAVSFAVKAAGYHAVVVPGLAAALQRHPHREWHRLSPDERAEKSKKNFDRYWRRWHHGQSLLCANFRADWFWPGHDHPRHVGGDHAHAPDELPPAGVPHAHLHQHWPDHAHDHPHTHVRHAAEQVS
ncbi:MAG: cysteine--tRNA ligase [Chloroflexi bacterium]|nr:cysteine--tRNA ligase [Chloroflexota bacterium]